MTETITTEKCSDRSPEASPQELPVLSSSSNSKHPISIRTRILVLSSIILPVALLPYLAIRPQLRSLRRNVEELGITNAVLQRDLKAALRKASITRQEHERVEALLRETKNQFRTYRETAESNEVLRSKAEEEMRQDLKNLVEECRHTRTRLDVLQEVGLSLADVAAFMHEVEIRQGWPTKTRDDHGIDRMRQLAIKLHCNRQTSETAKGVR